MTLQEFQAELNAVALLAESNTRFSVTADELESVRLCYLSANGHFARLQGCLKRLDQADKKTARNLWKVAHDKACDQWEAAVEQCKS